MSPAAQHTFGPDICRTAENLRRRGAPLVKAPAGDSDFRTGGAVRLRRLPVKIASAE